MESFEKAFNILMELEGGLSNDKDDKGGLTKYGISQAAYPDLDIENLTLEQAKNIYFKDYWKPSYAFFLAEVCEELGILHFDTAVDMGVKRAAVILQRAINKQPDKDIPVDGFIGRLTTTAVLICHLPLLMSDYLLLRLKYYARIANKKKTQRKFLLGWMNRVFKLQSLLQI